MNMFFHADHEFTIFGMHKWGITAYPLSDEVIKLVLGSQEVSSVAGNISKYTRYPLTSGSN